MVYIFDEPSMDELHAPARLSVEDGYGQPIKPTRGIWPPGEKGYYLSWDSPIGSSVDRNKAQRWRARNALAIRRLANRLEAPPGTDFHQLLRLAHGLLLSGPPHESRSDKNEDHRWVAEFEWELAEHGLRYPSSLTTLLAAYGARQGASWRALVPLEEGHSEEEDSEHQSSDSLQAGRMGRYKPLLGYGRWIASSR